MNKIDGRTIIFARMSYKEGTEEYNNYYKTYPQHKEIDDYMRSQPNLNSFPCSTYHEVNSPFADAAFMMLFDFQKLVEGPKALEKKVIDPEVMTNKIKQFGKFLGAVDVGITELKDEHLYSILGRPLAQYNRKVTTTHKYAIAIEVEMDKDMINRAPQLEEIFAVTKGYVDSAVIALWLTYYIKNLGYDTRAHIDGDYEVIAPLVARDAGLGQIGRNGLLVSPKYGQRIRLSVITTDLPLIPDKQINFGLHEFCKICKICAGCCPSKAIALDSGKIEGGNLRWDMKHESCYSYWQKVGTDCGVCLSSCPFSQEIEESKILELKNSPEKMKKLLKEHKEKYGKRNYKKDAMI